MSCSVLGCGKTASVLVSGNVGGSVVLLAMCAECSRAAAAVRPDLVVVRRIPPRRNRASS